MHRGGEGKGRICFILHITRSVLERAFQCTLLHCNPRSFVASSPQMGDCTVCECGVDPEPVLWAQVALTAPSAKGVAKGVVCCMAEMN